MSVGSRRSPDIFESVEYLQEFVPLPDEFELGFAGLHIRGGIILGNVLLIKPLMYDQSREKSCCSLKWQLAKCRLQEMVNALSCELASD